MYIAITLVVIFVVSYIALRMMVLTPPEISDKSALDYKVEVVDSVTTKCHNSWLHKDKNGIYEMYLEGSPFEMGVTNGKLTKKLAEEQEVAFFDFIKTLVPSDAMLNYLRYFITVFNRNLDESIPLDLRKEIYGLSLFASDDYDFVGDKYHRILNYHAAHDIGHTIQNMNLVNCTAFGVKGALTKDSSLLVGRNLDFSAGDEFARKKIVVFCNPDEGYKFAYISWGGMIGVLSGMNEYGLTITLNSAKSDIPFSAKTPVSIVAHMVLQHAKNIQEAYDIIKGQETFVSESFMVSSALDNKAVVIEKSLDKTAMYDPDKDKIVLTNHFQSDELKDTKLNQESIQEGCSLYRLQRCHELIDQASAIDYKKVIDILRDKNGKGDKSIGIGNEMALNQLICHHSVVFKPSKRIMWVSEFPYQENGFLAYDLNACFADSFDIKNDRVDVDSLEVGPTDFYVNGGVNKIWKYRHRLDKIKKSSTEDQENNLSDSFIEETVNMNPDFYYGYYVAGNYYKFHNQPEKALTYYNKAKEYEFPRKVDKEVVDKAIEQISKQ